MSDPTLGPPIVRYEDKITLRDRFAMAALTGLIFDSAIEQQLTDEVASKLYAKFAFMIANAMLVERNRE